MIFFFSIFPQIFGQIVYSIVGDDEALSLFNIDEQNGQIRLVRETLLDNRAEYSVSQFEAFQSPLSPLQPNINCPRQTA